jgi:hypothetical protein
MAILIPCIAGLFDPQLDSAVVFFDHTIGTCELMPWRPFQISLIDHASQDFKTAFQHLEEPNHQPVVPKLKFTTGGRLNACHTGGGEQPA